MGWQLRTPDLESARKWFQASLEEGSGLAHASLPMIRKLGRSYILDPRTTEDYNVPLIDNVGRGIRSSDADQSAGALIELLGSLGARTLIVEDDLQRKQDPESALNVTFVGDRVLRWEILTEDPSKISGLLRRGSSGYPLNAYVCTSSPQDLGLAPHATIDAAGVATIVASICAFFASIYDAETYIVLMSRDLGLHPEITRRAMDRGTGTRGSTPLLE